MIIHVLDTFPRLTETFILRELVELRRRGVDVRVIALRRGAMDVVHDEARRLADEVTFAPRLGGGVILQLIVRSAKRRERTIRLARSFLKDLRFGPRFAVQRLKGALRALALAPCVESATRFHAHFAHVAADVAEGLAGLTGKPWSVSVHAWDVFAQDTAIIQRRLATADRVFCCTFHLRNLLAESIPNLRERLVNMPHGLDLARFEPAPNAKSRRFLAIGRLEPKKGFDTLVNACVILRRRGVAFACAIIGDGSERNRLERLIVANGLDDVIDLRGEITLRDVTEAFGDAVALVLPSRALASGDRDGLPNVLLEAQAMELPVVTTAVGGVPEFVEADVNGLLVPPDDPERLAAAMASLLDDPETARRLGRRGREKVLEDFNIRETVKPLADYLLNQ